MVLSGTEALELTFKFEAIFEAFPDILFRLTRGGDILYCKAGRSVDLQISREQFIGRNITELLNESAEQQFKEAIKKLRKVGDVTNLEFPYTMNGKTHWFEARLVPFYKNEILAIVRNITKKKESERRIRKSECIYRSIARNIPDISIYVFDKDEKLILAEGEFIENSAFINTGLENRSLQEVLPGQVYSGIRSYVNESLQGNSRAIEVVSPVNFKTSLLTFCPLQYTEDNVLGGILICTSLENKKQAELEKDDKITELQKLNEQLTYELTMRKATDYNLGLYATELQKKNQELENFGYIATHDLQEPLRMVSVYCKLLQKRYKDKLDDTASEFINFAVEGANRMRKMIYDLRDYTDIDKSNRFFTNINMEYIVRSALASLKEETETSNAWITFDDLPVVKGDQKLLQLLIEHLISNAIKFISEDSRPEIHISATEHDDHWLFSVKDNGIGLNMVYKDRIFHIFQRLHVREKYNGTGIGLAICRKILETHHGQIWVESEPEIGSTFYFSLPK